MNFDDTPEEAVFRQEVRAWLDANARLRQPGQAPRATLGEASDAEMVEAARAWQAKKADAGWAGILWPEEFSGRGGTPMQQVIWRQEESRYDVPVDGLFAAGTQIAGAAIMGYGTEEQKREYLAPMLRGDHVYCQLFSEPGAGSDLAATRTTAVRDGDVWTLRGQKVWTSGAHYSTFGITLARTDPDVPKHRGLTAFVVDFPSPGLVIRPIRQLNGGEHFNEVFFDDLQVHDDKRLGGVGDGWRVAVTMLMNERVAVGVPGDLDRVFDQLLELARTTTRHGRPAIEDGAVRQKLAAWYVRLEAMRLTSYRVLTSISRQRQPGPEASVGKLVVPSLMQELSAFAMELQGADGLTQDAETPAGAHWQDQYLFWPAMRLGGGTDEIQRNIIGERILGLPSDPRVDRDVPFREVPTGSR